MLNNAFSSPGKQQKSVVNVVPLRLVATRPKFNDARQRQNGSSAKKDETNETTSDRKKKKNRVWNTAKGVAETVDEREHEEECGSQDEECADVADHIKLKAGLLLDEVLPLGKPPPVKMREYEEEEEREVARANGTETTLENTIVIEREHAERANEKRIDRGLGQRRALH